MVVCQCMVLCVHTDCCSHSHCHCHMHTHALLLSLYFYFAYLHMCTSVLVHVFVLMLCVDLLSHHMLCATEMITGITVCELIVTCPLVNDFTKL